MNEIKQFCKENPKFVLSFIGVFIVFLICSWVLYDAERNDAVYSDTDIIVDGIDQRLKDAGKRIDAVAGSVQQTEKAITDASSRIDRSKESAGEIEVGITECQNRLDSLTQRQGRIRNIIDEVERINRQRAQDSQKANLAE